MKGLSLSLHLKKIGACGESIEWAEGREIGPDAWNACKHGDWCLWYIEYLDANAYGLSDIRRWCVRSAYASASHACATAGMIQHAEALLAESQAERPRREIAVAALNEATTDTVRVAANSAELAVNHNEAAIRLTRPHFTRYTVHTALNAIAASHATADDAAVAAALLDQVRFYFPWERIEKLLIASNATNQDGE